MSKVTLIILDGDKEIKKYTIEENKYILKYYSKDNIQQEDHLKIIQ